MRISHINSGSIEGSKEPINSGKTPLFMKPALPSDIDFSKQNRRVELPVLNQLGISSKNASLFFGAIIAGFKNEKS